MSAIKKILLDKLNNSFSNEIINSSQVVYAMVQIRKVIELEKKYQLYPYLYLYASWLLHVDINRNYSQLILHQIDTEVKNYIEKGDSGYEKQLIPSVISSQNIKIEMENFLNEYKLPKGILIETSWRDFSKLLITDLIEVPLIPEKPNQFEYIEKMYYVRAPEPSDHNDPRKRVTPSLTLKLKKGERRDISFPAHEPYIY